jgi:hypothetical protein
MLLILKLGIYVLQSVQATDKSAANLVQSGSLYIGPAFPSVGRPVTGTRFAICFLTDAPEAAIKA